MAKTIPNPQEVANSLHIQLSDDGPKIPGKLVDAIIGGEVVFLCGSGVSSPQLPDFEGLVNGVYRKLAVEKSSIEAYAHEAGRYDEVLGTLKRRLIEPSAVENAVSDLLAVPASPDLECHTTILRLSRDRDNRVAVVTTNFDTLFERSDAVLAGEDEKKTPSVAGQALPAPGTWQFEGIVHIHGRIRDWQLKLERSQLVLTSSDLGDAYLRSGWASRFFFDLVRCRHIVIVGYSANDVPIRYILNVLEADRSRFTDLKKVYAFVGHCGDPKAAEAPWGPLGVCVIPYRIRMKDGHRQLWRDLRKLADYIDRRDDAFPARVTEILSQELANAGERALNEVIWFLKPPRDLWSEALSAIKDGWWFEWFLASMQWSEERVSWLVAAWVCLDLESGDRFEHALHWQKLMGELFTGHMECLLHHKKRISRKWRIIWRLFIQARPARGNQEITQRLRRPFDEEIVLDSDIHSTLDNLVPRLELRSAPREREEVDTAPDQPLHRILGARLYLEDEDEAAKWADELCKVAGRSLHILDQATTQLRSLLHLEKDLEYISDEHDHNDWEVPAVVTHDQNEHRGGKTHLVELMSSILPRAVDMDREGTLRIVHTWRNLPGRLGVRLFLQALRNTTLFSADEAIMHILSSVLEEGFWRMKREPAMVIKERAAAADPDLVRKLERRIIEGSSAHYGKFDLENGKIDWRYYARDAAAWRLLRMLRDAGVISRAGSDELAAITGRHDDLDRDMEDPDFFGSYISKPGFIVGNPALIEQAEPPGKLQKAREMVLSPVPEIRAGWSAYCKSAPEEALNVLTQEGYAPKDASLWETLIYALASPTAGKSVPIVSLRAQLMEHLYDVEEGDIEPIVDAICHMIHNPERSQIARLDEWLMKLWQVLLALQEDQSVPPGCLYKAAMESPAGRVSETLLAEISDRISMKDEPTSHHRQLLETITSSSGSLGLLGRAVLVRHIWFMICYGFTATLEALHEVLGTDEEEGKRLREVLLKTADTYPTITTKFKEIILKGIRQWPAEGYQNHTICHISEWIVIPAVAEITNDSPEIWGYTASEAAEALRQTCPPVRHAALETLRKYLRAADNFPKKGWHELGPPFFEKVWPRDSSFLTPEQTHGIVGLIVDAGDEFPNVLDYLKPYVLPPHTARSGLYIIADSNMPEQYPKETLELVWAIHCQSEKGEYGLPELVERLIKASLSLWADRRLQALELLSNKL